MFSLKSLMNHLSVQYSPFNKISIGVVCTLSLLSCTSGGVKGVSNPDLIPAKQFDLSRWKITLPMDDNRDGKADEVMVKQLKKYYHPDYFYLDANHHMVFTAPNKAVTTANSTNTRSELRQMIAGSGNFNPKTPKNNFAISAHPLASRFGAVGGKMSATLKVNHVAKRVGLAEKGAAHSVVVGQIHAVKNKKITNGFGWGNEPLKIFYKKFPGHDTGSVFWNYERNLGKKDPQRRDITYPVWGNTWKNLDDPGEAGVKLGETFSYEVNVHGNIMQLTFEAEGKPKVEYSINLANNINAYGEADPLDYVYGYAGDWFYFKAGAYNQCSVEKLKCEGTGDWETDKANGDYTSVSFSSLTLNDSTPIATDDLVAKKPNAQSSK